jgi:tetratricopeptide (TPR) repeat protein
MAGTKYPAYAVPLYESAIVLSPNDTGIRMSKVKALYSSGRVSEARSDLDYAIATNPNDTAPLVMTGNLLYENGEYEASVSYFEKALALNRKDAQIWVRKGDAQLAISVAQMQTMRERYRTITSASYTDGSSPSPPTNMDSFESMQSYRDAMTAYNEAIKLDPLVSVEISAHVLASTQSMVEMTSGILNDMGGSANASPTTKATS